MLALVIHVQRIAVVAAIVHFERVLVVLPLTLITGAVDRDLIDDEIHCFERGRVIGEMQRYLAHSWLARMLAAAEQSGQHEHGKKQHRDAESHGGILSSEPGCGSTDQT